MEFKTELEDYLTNRISAENIEKIGKSDKVNQELVDALWESVKTNKHPLAWRAAWALHHILSYNSNWKMMHQYIDEIINSIPNFTHNGQRRELLIVLQYFDINDLDIGKTVDLCYNMLFDSDEAIAVKAHAMQILYDISNIEPELKSELKQTLELMIQESSPGIKGRAKRLIKSLNKDLIRINKV